MRSPGMHAGRRIAYVSGHFWWVIPSKTRINTCHEVIHEGASAHAYYMTALNCKAHNFPGFGTAEKGHSGLRIPLPANT